MFEIETRFQSLERLIQLAEVKGSDPEISSHICKLGSVLICGAIERSVEIILSSRLSKGSPPQVKAFLRSYFKRGTNYHCDEIASLLYRIEKNWGDAFISQIEKETRVKESVNSCYAIRNSVAHGGGQSLGAKALRQYFDDAFTMISFLERAVNAPPVSAA